jgi:prolyl-tRNA synthetase
VVGSSHDVLALVSEDAHTARAQHRDEGLGVTKVVVVAHRHDDAVLAAEGADDVGDVLVERRAVCHHVTRDDDEIGIERVRSARPAHAPCPRREGADVHVRELNDAIPIEALGETIHGDVDAPDLDDAPPNDRTVRRDAERERVRPDERRLGEREVMAHGANDELDRHGEDGDGDGEKPRDPMREVRRVDERDLEPRLATTAQIGVGAWHERDGPKDEHEAPHEDDHRRAWVEDARGARPRDRGDHVGERCRPQEASHVPAQHHRQTLPHEPCYFNVRMLVTRALVPTLKEAPQDATSVSHALLLRAGYIRRVGAGIYDFLPLGLRVLRKVERIVREEMDRAEALEILMPVLLPGEYYKETNRWELYGDVLFRLKDRKGGDYNLAPTHEEIVTDIARREIRSYRDMPKNLYQIQTKFRDEPRPRAGLLRCREFLMKDAYSFDVSEAKALESYEKMRVAYTRIFERMGLRVRMVAADSGAMGGNTSAEFQALVDSGEDAIVACDKCDYAANVEVAEVKVVDPGRRAMTTTMHMIRIHTPAHRTIEEVSKFLQVKPSDMFKSLLYLAGGSKEVVMVLVRGDHELNEVKLARALGVAEVHMASEADVKAATGAEVGFAGPIGFKGKILIDRAAALVRNGVTGANETDYHLANVNHGRDFDAQVVDLRLAQSGDLCPRCDGGRLQAYRGIEAGHIFVLGTHYSAKMGATFLDEQQQQKPLVMGCYGIGVSRLVATTIEQHNDQDGIVWPMSVAPYHVHLASLGNDAAVIAAAKTIYEGLLAAGIEVLWDDRDERPGVKFKDADLFGIPLRVTIGSKGLASGGVELKPRTERDPKKAEIVPLDGAVKVISDRVHAALGSHG